MGPGVLVRDATPHDLLAVFACHVAAVRRLGRTHYSTEQVRAWARTDGEGPERYDDKALVVAERGGDVAGFGWTEGDEVVACYVHPDHARAGVGSALLDRLHDDLRAAGHETAVLHASLNAVGFYERRGYEVAERLVVEKRGVDFPVVRMERAL